MKICYGRKTLAAQLRATLKTLAQERESRHGIHEEASKMANSHSSKKIIYDIRTNIQKCSPRAKRVDWRKRGTFGRGTAHILGCK